MPMWGQEPDKVDRPSYLSEPDANSPVDPSGPTARKASFHDDTGEDSAGASVHAGWRVPLDGTDPEDGLEECLVAQSFSAANPRAFPGSAGNEGPNVASPNEQQVFEAFVGVPFRLVIRAVDVENDTLTILNIGSVPSWLTYNDNGNGSATYSGTPAVGDIGTHSVSYEADDASQQDDQTNQIIVSA